ncbi:MAG: hypothetical protein N2423_10520 [Novosphingobium sp.]|nr:hypothetical protein [Novosphingobium sp.]
MLSPSRAEKIDNLRELIRACRKNALAMLSSLAFLASLAFVAFVEGVLIGLALATVYGDARGIQFPAWFYLDEEFSFGEIWEYLLTASAAAGLLWRYKRFGEPIIGCLGLVFVWLVLDNALAVHESIGHQLSPLFAFAQGSTPNPDDYGELAAFAFIALVIVSGLLMSTTRSNRDSVIQSGAIVALLGLAAFFGVLFDFVDHALAGDSPLLRGVLSVVEDGSESVTLAMAAVMAMTARPLAGIGRPIQREAEKALSSSLGA